MIQADNTPDKSRLGANSILGISINCARASALAPKHSSLGNIWKQNLTFRQILTPDFFLNVINGGMHAGNNLKFQEYIIISKR